MNVMVSDEVRELWEGGDYTLVVDVIPVGERVLSDTDKFQQLDDEERLAELPHLQLYGLTERTLDLLEDAEVLYIHQLVDVTLQRLYELGASAMELRQLCAAVDRFLEQDPLYTEEELTRSLYRGSRSDD